MFLSEIFVIRSVLNLMSTAQGALPLLLGLLVLQLSQRGVIVLTWSEFVEESTPTVVTGILL